MAFNTTGQKLLDGVRFAVRRQQTGVLPDADLIPLLNQGMRDLWIMCGRLNRDEFWKISQDFTISAGFNTVQISSIPVSDYLDLRGIDIKLGTNQYVGIRPFRFSQRGAVAQLSYRLRRGFIDILPFALAASYTYRLHYTFMPTEITAGNLASSIDVPMAGDEYVIYHAAAKVRPSFAEDPSADLKLRDDAASRCRQWLVSHGQGPAETVPEADPYDDDGGHWGAW